MTAIPNGDSDGDCTLDGDDGIPNGDPDTDVDGDGICG